MTKVTSAFRVANRKLTKGDLGIEVEVEGEHLPTPNKYWRSEHDDSLRGECREYVLKRPLSLPDARMALSYLDNCYHEAGTTVHESVRAGVHVHVNVQKLTVVQLFSFMVVYIILEDILIKYCGEYREGNLFCLRTKDAEFLLYNLERVAKGKEYRYFESDVLRYSSMNVCSLWSYGSLEFRAMRGTRDLDVIGDWAEILLNLRNEAIKFDNPAQVVEMLQRDGAESFLETFLGTFKETLCNALPYEELINEGLVRAYQLAMSPDWTSFNMKDIGGLLFPADVEFPDVPEGDY